MAVYRSVALTVLFFLFLVSTAYSQQISSPGILPSNASYKEIFSGGDDFLEGAAMSPDGMLYFSDFPNYGGEPSWAGTIWMVNPATKESKIFRSPSGMSNGMKFDANGDLVVCERASLASHSSSGNSS